MGSRPTAGHAALDRRIGVRIPAPQLWSAPVAQLDRASDFGSEGWGFKSLRAYSEKLRVSRSEFRVTSCEIISTYISRNFTPETLNPKLEMILSRRVRLVV